MDCMWKVKGRSRTFWIEQLGKAEFPLTATGKTVYGNLGDDQEF